MPMSDSPAAVIVDGTTGTEKGVAGAPIRTDPTGTTTQPVSAASLPLPTGAATEATLATRATEATLATRASEATVASIDTEVTSIDAKTPALGQAAMTNSTPVAIASDQSAVPVSGNITVVDTSGNEVPELEGTAIGVTHAAMLTAFKDEAGAYKIPVVTDGGRIKVEAADAALPDDLTTIVRARLLNIASSNMIVDGSIVPVAFTYTADPTDDVRLNELRLVMSANAIGLDGNSFGKGGGALLNGLLVQTTTNGSTVQLANVKSNEEFFLFPSTSSFLQNSGATDIIVVSFPLGVNLMGGTADNVTITVRDNLTGGARDLNFLQASVTGRKEV